MPNGRTSSNFGSALAVGGGYGIGSTLGNAGGVTVCGGNDTSFYCRFVQFFNVFKMFIIILLFIAVIVYFAYAFSGAKGSKKGNMKGGCGCSSGSSGLSQYLTPLHI
jgi:hypothetical protein